MDAIRTRDRIKLLVAALVAATVLGAILYALSLVVA